MNNEIKLLDNSNVITGVYSKYGAFLTVTDLTKILKVSRFVVDRMLKTGQLPAAKLGGQYSNPCIILAMHGSGVECVVHNWH